MLSTNTKDLYAALKELSVVVPRSSSLSVLQHVLCEARDGTLRLTGTDLESYVSCTLPCEGDDVTACLPLRELVQLVKPLNKRDVAPTEITIDGTIATIRRGTLTGKLEVLDSGNYPAGFVAPDVEMIPIATWPCAALRDSFGYVLPAASEDISRPQIETVNFVDDWMITTDGHRLHLAPLPGKPEASILLPRSGARVLHKWLTDDGDIVLSRVGDVLRWMTTNWCIEMRLSNEIFPDYTQVVPKEKALTSVTCEVRLLIAALRQVKKEKGIVITIVDRELRLTGLTVSTTAPLVEIEGAADFKEVGINPAYLLDAIITGEDHVTLHFRTKYDPVDIIGSRGKRALVMPKRF